MPLSFTRKAQVPFIETPEICTTGRTPSCNWFHFRSIPQKPTLICRSYQTRQAAGRRTVEVAPEVAHRCGRPRIFDLGRGPWGSPDARAWLRRARHPASSLARTEHCPEPPPGEFTIFHSPVAGWMPLEVTPSLVTSLGCHSRGGGVVQAWLGLGYGFQHQPRRRG